jgi:hypothetical protein
MLIVSKSHLKCTYMYKFVLEILLSTIFTPAVDLLQVCLLCGFLGGYINLASQGNFAESA